MVCLRKFDPERFHRRSIRLTGYDYRSPGLYFITMLAADPEDFFGAIQGSTMIMNEFGTIAESAWKDLPNHNPHISLDEFVIMPDHMHGIIVIHQQNNALPGHGLPEIVRQFKTFSARRINALRRVKGEPVWKRNYYEHIIRNRQELHRIRLYIQHNPVRAGSKPARGGHTPVGAGSKPARGSKPTRGDDTSVVNRFRIHAIPSGISPIGSGHINDSYLVSTTPDNAPGYVLQRINHAIFHDIHGLMNNIDLVTRHMRGKFSSTRPPEPIMQVLELIPSRDGTLFYTDEKGDSWRLYKHIHGSHSYDRVPGPDHAFEGGRAFGLFQMLTAELDPGSLAVTIPRFHDITWRMEQFNEAIRIDTVHRVSSVKKEIRFVRNHAEEMHTIHRLLESGRLPVRVTHNDTKFNNILFNGQNQAICIVDLDTVMPGSVLFDFGDAIRTGANTAEEDEPDLTGVELDMGLFEAYTKGFLEAAGHILTPLEHEHLSFSAKFMTFLIGLRFLTDYLNGDIYYKIRHHEHNLQRARVQFALLRSMEARFREMTICTAG